MSIISEWKDVILQDDGMIEKKKNDVRSAR